MNPSRSICHLCSTSLAMRYITNHLGAGITQRIRPFIHIPTGLVEVFGEEMPQVAGKHFELRHANTITDNLHLL